MDRLARCDLAIYADSDSIERLERVRSRLGAIVTGAVAEFDASGAWAPSGARTAAAWLRRHCRLPSNEASREVRRGRQCRELPHFEAAWSAGEIGAACVDLVASVRRPATEAALARDEEMLVDYAKTLAFAEFVRVLRYWEQHADPDGAEEDAMEQQARRDVYLVPSMGGTFLGKMTLDPISGAIVSGELERRERELFEADWAKARGELGRDPTGRRAGPHLGPAPGRCPGRDGHPLGHGAGRRAPACPPLQCARRLPDPVGPHLPVGPRGHRDLPGHACCRGWTRPTSSGPCSPRAEGSRSASPLASSPVPPAGPSSCGTKSASTPTATNRPSAVRPITSSNSPKVARPPRRTVSSSAASTIASATSGRRRATEPDESARFRPTIPAETPSHESFENTESFETDEVDQTPVHSLMASISRRNRAKCHLSKRRARRGSSG